MLCKGVNVRLSPIQKWNHYLDIASSMKLVGTLHSVDKVGAAIEIVCTGMYPERDYAMGRRKLHKGSMQQEGVSAPDLSSPYRSAAVSYATQWNSDGPTQVAYCGAFGGSCRLSIVKKEGGWCVTLVGGKPKQRRRIYSAACEHEKCSPFGRRGVPTLWETELSLIHPANSNTRSRARPGACP